MSNGLCGSLLGHVTVLNLMLSVERKNCSGAKTLLWKKRTKVCNTCPLVIKLSSSFSFQLMICFNIEVLYKMKVTFSGNIPTNVNVVGCGSGTLVIMPHRFFYVLYKICNFALDASRVLTWDFDTGDSDRDPIWTDSKRVYRSIISKKWFSTFKIFIVYENLLLLDRDRASVPWITFKRISVSSASFFSVCNYATRRRYQNL